MLVRPMKPGDVDAVEQLTGEAFYRLDAQTHPADWPAPERRSPERSAGWRRRCLHLIEHDSPGCWVAEESGRLVGAVASVRREGLWGLSTYAVAPAAQGRGVGRALLDAALEYSHGCTSGIICSSHDPRAARRYREAGFTLHPAMLLRGPVDRSALPVIEYVREGTASDIDLLNMLDRLTRGAAHGPDHELLVREYRLRVVDRPKGQGYCYLYPEGGPYLLAASNRRTAATLLWQSLAEADSGEPVMFDFLTAEQEWAVDVGLAAGLEIHQRGYLALLHMKPPMPYIPSGHFL